jgi:hypothetical protein
MTRRGTLLGAIKKANKWQIALFDYTNKLDLFYESLDIPYFNKQDFINFLIEDNYIPDDPYEINKIIKKYSKMSVKDLRELFI